MLYNSLFNKQQDQSKASSSGLFVCLTDCAVIMGINSGMCPFVLCNTVQQDNVTPLVRSHDTDLRQLCTHTHTVAVALLLLIIDL